MSSGRWSTHAIELTSDTVTKRFRKRNPEQGCGREWRALTLLAEHAPGLAAHPIRAEPDGPEPAVVMSRLPGVPLRGMPLGEEHVTALAKAVHELQAAVPARTLAGLPVRPWQQGDAIDHIRRWAPDARAKAGPEVGRAMDAGLCWLDRSGWGSAVPADVPPVFGPGDGNLANFLWDGSTVRILDFEDSGRSDRAYELAEITEHVGSWVERPLDAAGFLGHFDLSPAESARLPGCRRLLALIWLLQLALEDPAAPRNPPGTVERQADRLMALLP